VRRVLGAGRFGMLEPLRGAFDVTWHGDVTSAILVVPCKGEAAVASAFPIFTNFVVVLEDGHEMIGVVFGSIFNSKIVDDKGKVNRMSVMLPKARSDRDRPVAVWVQEFEQLIVCKAAGLG
jgi:hypothetical protein